MSGFRGAKGPSATEQAVRIATAIEALVEPARKTAIAFTHIANHLGDAVETARVEQVLQHGLAEVEKARLSLGLPPLVESGRAEAGVSSKA